MAIAALFALIGIAPPLALAAGPDYRMIPGHSFRTIFPPDGKIAAATVAPFSMRATPVSTIEFQRFVRAQPQWRRDRIASVFADRNYLAAWPDALGIDPVRSREPVTQVSWFAAQAFCESEGARLPTWYEWETAAAADEKRIDARDDPAWRERILTWYSKPTGATLPNVGMTPANRHGVRDLHGVVWEWVYDFGSLMVSADSREQSDPDTMRFCGAGALAANDRENYAVLMRVALLSSLDATGTTRNLGFRCARELTTKPKRSAP